MSKQRFRNVCSAYFGEEEDIKFDPEIYRYMVYQKEVCPDTQNIHYQIYFELFNGMTASAINKKLFPKKHINCIERKGTSEQAAAYCKDQEKSGVVKGTVKEFGTMSKPGSRTDLKDITKKIIENVPMRDVAINYGPQFIRYSKGFRELARIVHKPPFRANIKIIYLFGPPRTGKSKYAYENYPDAYTCLDNSQGWMDGYEGEKTVIFDEFQGLFPRNLILKICDRYPVQVPIKGSFVNFCAETIIITSNSHPDSLYDAAFRGRLENFGKIIFCPRLGVLVEDMIPSETSG